MSEIVKFKKPSKHPQDQAKNDQSVNYANSLLLFSSSVFKQLSNVDISQEELGEVRKLVYEMVNQFRAINYS